MSDHQARHASVFSVAAVFVGLGLFLLVLRYVYDAQPVAKSFNIASEKLPEDQAWKATPEGRKKHLQELRDTQQKQAASTDWIDRNKSVVRLPLEQAMKLTADEIKAGTRK